MQDYALEKGPKHAKAIAKHYGIYEDLFNGAEFLPVVDLGVFYECDDDGDKVTPVYRGNVIDPGEVRKLQHIFLLFCLKCIT